MILLEIVMLIMHLNKLPSMKSTLDSMYILYFICTCWLHLTCVFNDCMLSLFSRCVERESDGDRHYTCSDLVRMSETPALYERVFVYCYFYF